MSPLRSPQVAAWRCIERAERPDHAAPSGIMTCIHLASKSRRLRQRNRVPNALLQCQHPSSIHLLLGRLPHVPPAVHEVGPSSSSLKRRVSFGEYHLDIKEPKIRRYVSYHPRRRRICVRQTNGGVIRNRAVFLANASRTNK